MQLYKEELPFPLFTIQDYQLLQNSYYADCIYTVNEKYITIILHHITHTHSLNVATTASVQQCYPYSSGNNDGNTEMPRMYHFWKVHSKAIICRNIFSVDIMRELSAISSWHSYDVNESRNDTLNILLRAHSCCYNLFTINRLCSSFTIWHVGLPHHTGHSLSATNAHQSVHVWPFSHFTELRFHVLPDMKKVILKNIFPANLLASKEKRNPT